MFLRCRRPLGWPRVCDRTKWLPPRARIRCTRGEPTARRERENPLDRDVTRYRLSMDIGGTFTDVVAYDEAGGTYMAGKSSTTPRDLTEGVLNALAMVVPSAEDCG